jgi:hypothetical protein
MMIFQRIVTFQGPPDEVAAWALEITDVVNTRTHLATSLWQGVFGVPVGALGWSAVVDNLTALEAANDILVGDAAYVSLLSKAAGWITAPGQDSWLQMIHTSGGEFIRPAVGSYSESTVAIPNPGKVAQAGAFGVEIADLHTQLTHAPVLFCSSAYGAFGEMRWLALYDSATHVDSAAELVAKDDEYLAKIDAAGELFVAGLAQRGLARRIA